MLNGNITFAVDIIPAPVILKETDVPLCARHFKEHVFESELRRDDR
jgi:hypothetical protein